MRHPFEGALTRDALLMALAGRRLARCPIPTLKRELADDADWATRDEARTAVFEYIEVWYNQRRRHASLGDVSPVAFELQQERMRELTTAA